MDRKGTVMTPDEAGFPLAGTAGCHPNALSHRQDTAHTSNFQFANFSW
jgi:hypothetical protein